MGLVVDESGDDPPEGEERLVNLPRLLLAVSDSAGAADALRTSEIDQVEGPSEDALLLVHAPIKNLGFRV